jgi:hypothetical protein
MQGKWTRAMVDEAAFAVKDEIIQRVRTEDHKQVLDDCLMQLSDMASHRSPEQDAKRVYYGIASIVLVATRPTQADQLVPKLDKLVKSILLAYKVKPRTSKLSHMYQHLALAKAYHYCSRGDISKAILESSIGFALSRNSVRLVIPLMNLAHANIVLQKGCAQQAADIFAEVRKRPEWGFEAQLGFIAEIRSLRLSEQYEAAHQLLSDYQEKTLLEGLQLFIDWERVILKARVEGVPILEKFAAEGSLLDKGIYALNKLWFFSKILPMKDPGIKASHLRAVYQRMIIKDLRFRYGTEIIEAFEAIYDTDIPFENRLSMAQEAMEGLDKVDIETRLMALATLTRWFERNDQMHMAFVAAEDYRSLSLRLSQGKNPNLLGVFGFEPLATRMDGQTVLGWLESC